MEAKSNPHCYICSSRVGVSNRNAVEIFNIQNKLPSSDKLLAICISDFTGKPIHKETIHSLIICKKCFKLFQEYDELEYRLNEIKVEMMTQFKKTLIKNNINFDVSQKDLTDAALMEEDLPSESGNAGSKDASKTIPKINWTNPAILPSLKKISPMPANLVIVGHKGKKITIQKPVLKTPLKRSNSSIDMAESVELQMEKLHESNIDSIEITSSEQNKDTENSNSEIVEIQKDGGNSNDDITYLSEVDGIIVKSEDKTNDEFVLRNLEIVDDGVSNMPMEDGAIFMEQAEDGSIIRVVSGNNILQDEHGNIIYTTEEDGDIEMILPDQNSEELQVQYEEISLKDENNIIKLNSSSILNKNLFKNQYIKSDSMLDIDRCSDDNKGVLDNLDIDPDNYDALEIQTAAVKASDNLYSCLICETVEEHKRKSTNKDEIDKVKSEGDSENDDAEKESNSAFLGDATSMMHHMETMHDTKIYICDICGEVLLSRSILSEHIEEHLKESTGDFQCDICSKCFASENLLRRHQKILHLRSKNHPCTICHRKFGSKALLEEHSNIHKGLKPYTCFICMKTFASKYTHQSHFKTHTDRPRPYTCTQCGKSFFALANLTQHEKTHLGIKDFVCKICGKGFCTRHNLEVHGVVHTGHKPYKCKTCNKAFARKAEIQDHERTHTGERPYFCEICGATFSQRSNLQSHKRATHFNDKRYKCRLCEKCFKRRRLLEYHIKATHTGERPFRCQVCDATFVYPEHFKKHQRIHSGEKPYKCEVCGKAFNSRDNRNAHRFVHSDKKPYECLDCGAGFMRKPFLYAHMHSQGHLSDTIVVNQPRLGGDAETTSDENKTFVIGNQEEGSSNKPKIETTPSNSFNHSIPILVNTSEQSEDGSAMTVKTEHILPDEEYLAGTESVIDDDMLNSQRIEIIDNDGGQEFIQSEDGSIRIVQIRLPDGENAWVALNE